jgi:hypothetical protein
MENDTTPPEFKISDLNLNGYNIVVEFRSFFNVVWDKPIQGKKALAFIKGFPGIMIMTDRRLIIVAQFLEKQGWLQKKTLVSLAFEVGLQHLSEKQFNIKPKEKIFNGHLRFKPHGMVGDTIVQFVKLDPNIALRIEDHLSHLEIKKPLEDTGIVLLNADILGFIKKRLTKK